MTKQYIRFAFKTIFFLLILGTMAQCSEDEENIKTPGISVLGEINDFEGTKVLQHSPTQSIQVSGVNLTEDLVINVSENFEISLDENEFTNKITIEKSTAMNKNSTVYVRFAPLEKSLGKIVGMLNFYSSDKQQVIEISGVALAQSHSIVVSTNTLNFGSVDLGESSQPQTMTIKGDDLKAGIDLSVDQNFEISFDGTTYAHSLQIPLAQANQEKTLYVRFTPQNAGTFEEMLTLKSGTAEDVMVTLKGTGVEATYNYPTFNQAHVAFGGGNSQFVEQTFTLHPDVSHIEGIKMYVKLECPTGGCDPWDVFAHVQVKDPASGEWYEMGRYITPYGVDNHQLARGFEIDVTDFKSLLSGTVELRAYTEVWGPDGWLVSVDFDYIAGTPEYAYSAISSVVQYNKNSLEGVPYGVDHSSFDLTKTIQVPSNAENTYLRTIITGWGHATPMDAGGRPCAEWCFRTHDVLINSMPTFTHDMGPIGCGSNPVSPQYGNWQPNRAGWCPGMAVPVRIDNFTNPMAGTSFDFEYDFEDWTADGGTASGQNGAYYAISTFVVVQSNTPISKPVVN